MWSKELAPPLTAEEEKALFKRYANGDKEAKEKLIAHNLRLVVHVCKQYPISGVEREDLLSIGALGLHKAVKGFKVNKGVKFSTFATMCIKNELLMEAREIRRTYQDVSFETAVHRVSNGNEFRLEEFLQTPEDGADCLLEKQMVRELVIDQIAELPSRNQAIMNDLLGLSSGVPLSQAEVGKQYGLSQYQISRIRSKLIYDMKKKIAI